MRGRREERPPVARISYMPVRWCSAQLLCVLGEVSLRYRGVPARGFFHPRNFSCWNWTICAAAFILRMDFPSDHLCAEALCTALEIRTERTIDESMALHHLFACDNWEISAEIPPIPIEGAPYGWRQEVLALLGAKQSASGRHRFPRLHRAHST